MGRIGRVHYFDSLHIMLMMYFKFFIGLVQLGLLLYPGVFEGGWRLHSFASIMTCVQLGSQHHNLEQFCRPHSCQSAVMCVRLQIAAEQSGKC